MKTKLGVLLLSIVIFVLMVNVAYAAGSKLIFSKVDAKVGGKSDRDLHDGETIGEDAKPGDNIEFRVKMENNFTSQEDLKIKDITVKVTIEGIDDGDDLEEESSEFDLNQGNDKTVTLKFEVPVEVDEDTFDVLIEAEGEDKNGTNHAVDMRIKLDVNKDSHKLMIAKNILSPSEISCNRKNIQLSATVINVGTEDENDVTVEALNSDLDISLKDEIGELTAEPNQEESRFSKEYRFDVPPDAEAGSYPITLRTIYDDGRKKAEESATLTVNDCVTAKKPAAQTKEETSEEEQTSQEVEVISGKTTAPVVQQPAPETVVTQESFLSSDAFVVGVIIAEIVIVLVGVILVVSLFRRRG